MPARPIQPVDRNEWLRMRQQLWPDAEPAEHAEEIDEFYAATDRTALSTLHEVFVYEDAPGKLCGLLEVSIRSYAEGCTSNRVGYLEGWYVDAAFRGQGIGRALVAAAEAWARAEGCTEMASDTEIANLDSQQAHARLGYAEVERTVHFRKSLIDE